MTKEDFKAYQKECDARLMQYIGGDWSFISSLEIGQKFRVPANCIAPDTLGEWLDAKVDGYRAENHGKAIDVHIGYGEILTVCDGHNRLKSILNVEPDRIITVIFRGTR